MNCNQRNMLGLFLIIFCLTGADLFGDKIFGGQETAIVKVPWQVALEENGEIFCAGSIISAKYILTGASCTRFKIGSELKVRAGSGKLQNGGILADVEAVYWNENYDMLYRDYDVSIVVLKQPLIFDQNIQPVSLRKTTALTDEIALVAGWGVTNHTVEENSETLRSVEIPIIDYKTCNDVYYELTNRMICAGDTGKNSCYNDDGSALTVNNIQVGIASWAYGCGEKGFPGVYTNVAAVADYINEFSGNEATWV